MLIISISLAYICNSIYHPASYSLITQLFRPQDRPKALGFHALGGPLGIAIGPISLSLIMGLFALGWRPVYLFWFVPVLLGIVSTLVLRPEFSEKKAQSDSTEVEASSQNESMFTLSLVFFLVSRFIHLSSWLMISTFMPIYIVDVRGFSDTISSFIYGSSSMMGVIASPIGGYLASKFGVKRWLFTSYIITISSMGFAVFTQNNIAFVILYLFFGFSKCLSLAANSSIMAQLSPKRSRGLGYALFFFPVGITGVVAPLLAANLAETFGLTSIITVALSLFAVGLIILQISFRMRERD
jgi:MFS family permease